MMNVQASSIADNFSLVLGGPFYKALRRTHLIDEYGAHIRGRIAAFFALTWLPLVMLSAVEGTALGNKVKIPLLYDFSIYGRFLVSLPLLIAAEAIIDPFIGRVVSTFNVSGIIREKDLPAYHAALEKTARLRDSGLIEFLLALLACVPFFLFADYGWVSNHVTVWHGATSVGLRPAGWWFVFVSSPLLRFLMLRWLWRYALWSYLLRSVAKLNLDMMPTHPDLMGGLGFVPYAQRQFGILAAALGSVIASQLGNSIAYFGERISAAKVSIVVFVLIAVLVVLLPLTLLSPKLIEVRRDGLARYSRVARRLTGSFDAKWAQTTGSPTDSMLGSPDPSSLVDYISSFTVIRDMQIVPISKYLVIQVAAQAAAPFVLVWMLATPFEEIITEILKKLL
jgi:hypothetical protein